MHSKVLYKPNLHVLLFSQQIYKIPVRMYFSQNIIICEYLQSLPVTGSDYLERMPITTQGSSSSLTEV